MTPVTLTFRHKKETTNKQRFEEDVVEGAKPIVGSLYVDKAIVGESKTLTVTIAS